jgi:hypothetical protein
MVSRLLYCGLVVRQSITAERTWWNKAAHLIVVGKQSREVQGGLRRREGKRGRGRGKAQNIALKGMPPGTQSL